MTSEKTKTRKHGFRERVSFPKNFKHWFKDSYETLIVTRELITSHLQSNETSPIAVIIGADEE